jgi:hypothetical protein
MEDWLKSLSAELDVTKPLNKTLQEDEWQALWVKDEELQVVWGDWMAMEDQLNTLHEELNATKQLHQNMQEDEQQTLRIPRSQSKPDVSWISALENDSGIGGTSRQVWQDLKSYQRPGEDSCDGRCSFHLLVLSGRCGKVHHQSPGFSHIQHPLCQILVWSFLPNGLLLESWWGDQWPHTG